MTNDATSLRLSVKLKIEKGDELKLANKCNFLYLTLNVTVHCDHIASRATKLMHEKFNVHISK